MTSDFSPIQPTTEAAILALNNAHATELSWLDHARLQALLQAAFYARSARDATAFLLAFDHRADYDSPNYQWFRARETRFVYVDRVVVAPAARGHGVATRLYEDLIRHATAAKLRLICCEVNLDPPNPASDAFHARLGFTEAGRAPIHGGSKTVRYLSRAIGATS